MNRRTLLAFGAAALIASPAKPAAATWSYRDPSSWIVTYRWCVPGGAWETICEAITDETAFALRKMWEGYDLPIYHFPADVFAAFMIYGEIRVDWMRLYRVEEEA